MLEEDALGLLDQVGAALRARVVERGDEIGAGGAIETLQYIGARGEQVGERDAAEIVADQRAGGRAALEAAWKAETPGWVSRLTRRATSDTARGPVASSSS